MIFLVMHPGVSPVGTFDSTPRLKWVLEARIEDFELAYRMQAEEPEALDVSLESEANKRPYGLDQETTRDFRWPCLLAQRLSERDVRAVQSTQSGAEEERDQHAQVLRPHPLRAR